MSTTITDLIVAVLAEPCDLGWDDDQGAWVCGPHNVVFYKQTTPPLPDPDFPYRDYRDMERAHKAAEIVKRLGISEKSACVFPWHDCPNCNDETTYHISGIEVP